MDSPFIIGLKEIEHETIMFKNTSPFDNKSNDDDNIEECVIEQYDDNDV